MPRQTRQKKTRLIPLSDAILLAGEDRWTVQHHGVGRSTRYEYERHGIPAREVADDLVDWYQGKRGALPAREVETGDAYDLTERIRLTREYFRTWGTDNVIWRMMGEVMEDALRVAVRQLHRPRPARAKRAAQT